MHTKKEKTKHDSECRGYEVQQKFTYWTISLDIKSVNKQLHLVNYGMYQINIQKAYTKVLRNSPWRKIASFTKAEFVTNA